jgi:NAD(P)-dependent dehydrogenase (short-subunit alcohol dehydrogenase family)
MLKIICMLFLFIIAVIITVPFLIKLKPQILDGKRGCRLVKIPNPQLIFKQKQSNCIAITGASSGIGLALARNLSDYEQVQLILTGGSKERAFKALEGKKRSTPLLAASLDMEDDESIDQFVRDLKNTIRNSCGDKLDYLFLNAGILYGPTYVGRFETKDGKEDRVIRVNFLGNVRLLKSLFDVIKRSNTRVIYVSSSAHYAGDPKWVLEPFLDPTKSWNPTANTLAYTTSKLAMNTVQQLLTKDGRVPNSVSVSQNLRT